MVLLFISFVMIASSWIVLIASPIPSNFDTMASSFWVTMLASLTNLAVLVLSGMEYYKVGGGAASAAK